jgi:hypothetical protein
VNSSSFSGGNATTYGHCQHETLHRVGFSLHTFERVAPAQHAHFIHAAASTPCALCSALTNKKGLFMSTCSCGSILPPALHCTLHSAAASFISCVRNTSTHTVPRVRKRARCQVRRRHLQRKGHPIRRAPDREKKMATANAKDDSVDRCARCCKVLTRVLAVWGTAALDWS